MDFNGRHISYGAYVFLILTCLLVYSLKVSDSPSFFSDPDAGPFQYGAREGVVPAVPATSSSRLVLGLRVDINSAEIEELTLLPGIGPRLALRIVEKRDELGHFAAAEALLEVDGIGPAKLAAIEGFIEVKDR
jgi:competence ComEA-like helix-hairpin-helix protein